MLGALRVLNRIERLAETLRAALNALATVAPEWVRTWVPSEWYERYGRRIEEYRLPKGQAARAEYVAHVGADGHALLTTLAAEDIPEQARHLAEVEVLRCIWQQHLVADSAGRWQLCDPKALPTASEAVESPYEAEARSATKRGMHWVGSKVHLTETCDDDAPHLVTQVDTTSAPATDVGQLAHIQQDLAEYTLLPSHHLVDAGYVRAQHVVESRTLYAIELVGPVDTDHQWQARIPDGYTTERFIMDWDQHTARCPQGHQRLRWSEMHTARQRTMIHIDFDAADCLPCPVRSWYTRAQTGSGARSLTLQSRAEYEVLLSHRRRQQTPEFLQEYGRRAGIEGTISQGVRAFGLRQARYRGLRKTHLQGVATATAMNLERLDDWLHDVPRAATRCSRLAQLAPAC
jgi:transposase